MAVQPQDNIYYKAYPWSLNYIESGVKDEGAGEDKAEGEGKSGSQGAGQVEGESEANFGVQFNVRQIF